MKYLCFNRWKSGQKEGLVQAVVRTKDRKYGPVVEQETVGRRTPTLITGLHDSGKSCMIERLYLEERAIWGKTSRPPALWLGALRPLQVRTAPVEMPILPTVRMQKLWAEGSDV